MLRDTALHFGAAYVVAAWAIRIVMLVVVPLRRSPQAAASWLLLIFSLLIPDPILFLAIGRATFPQWRADRFVKFAPFFADTTARLRRSSTGSLSAPPVVDLAYRLGGFRLSVATVLSSSTTMAA